MSVELVCLDMAGTTVLDDGTVMAAFIEAISEAGLAPNTEPWHAAMRTVNATMGQSKIEVFRLIFGDENTAHRANSAFERAYQDEVRGGAVTPMPGARQLFRELRERGIRVCLTTGFSPLTRDGIVSALRWDDLVDLALSPADSGRGRPWPDLVLTAVLRLRIGSVDSVVVVGDTPSDIESGVRAGAGVLVGVTSGSGSAEELFTAGAHHVLPDVGSLTRVLFPAVPLRSPA